MKAIKYVGIAAAAFALAACSTDENGATDSNAPVELRLTSGVEVSESRAAANTQDTQILKDQEVYVWVEDAGTPDDASTVKFLYNNIYVADGNGGFTDYITGGVSYASKMYFPQTGHNVNIYAIVSDNTSTNVGTIFPITVNIYKKSNVEQCDALYAVHTNVQRNGNPTTQKLMFHHLFSKLEIAVKVGAGNPELKSIGIKDIINVGNVVLPKTFDVTDENARLDMSYSETGSLDLVGNATCSDFDTNVVYNGNIILPQNVSEKVIEFTLKDGGVLKYTIPKNTEFKRGYKYRYHVTLNLTSLEVTSEIVNWNDGGTATGDATMQ